MEKSRENLLKGGSTDTLRKACQAVTKGKVKTGGKVTDAVLLRVPGQKKTPKGVGLQKKQQRVQS